MGSEEVWFMESTNVAAPVQRKQTDKDDQEGPNRCQILLYVNVGLIMVTMFWLLVSSSYYSYGNNSNLNFLRVLPLFLNAGSAVCFMVSMIGASLGFTRMLKRRLSTRLSVISMIIGLILLMNSILIYALRTSLYY